jgi:hypothetical protein
MKIIKSESYEKIAERSQEDIIAEAVDKWKMNREYEGSLFKDESSDEYRNRIDVDEYELRKIIDEENEERYKKWGKNLGLSYLILKRGGLMLLGSIL